MQEVVIRAVVWGPGEHGTEAPGRGFKTAFPFSLPLSYSLALIKEGEFNDWVASQLLPLPGAPFGLFLCQHFL